MVNQRVLALSAVAAILVFAGFAVLGGHTDDKGFWGAVVIFSISQLLWRLRSADDDARGYDDAATAAAAANEPLFDETLTARVRFDATGWTFVSKERTNWLWRDEVGNMLALQVIKGTLGPVPSDLDVVWYCRSNIGFSSGLVEARPFDAASFRGLVYIEKSERPPGYGYLGRVHVLLEHQTVVLAIVAVEKGVTGVREASVVAEALNEGRISIPASAPSGTKIPGWFVDPYDRARDGRTICSIADEQKYDAKFPSHPLSRIRRTLRQVEGSFEIRSAVPGAGDPWPHAPLSASDDQPPTVH